MAKINLETILKDQSGQEYQNKQELGGMLLFALNQVQKGEDFELCYSLRKRIFEGGEIELTKNECDVLKVQVNNAQGLTRAHLFSFIDILEG